MDEPSARLGHHRIRGDSLRVGTDERFREARPGTTIDFGRAASLVVDACNPHLHRVAGRFVHREGRGWILENRCRTATMVVVDDDSGSYARLAPGRVMPLPFVESTIAFDAGRRRYRLAVRCNPWHEDIADEHAAAALRSRATLPHVACPPLNDEQVALLRLLIEPRLCGPVSPAELPSNRDLAARLAWSLPKLNRKLDRLCAKFARAGIDGLVPDGTSRGASERRLHLVDAMVENAWLDALAQNERDG